MRVLAGAFALSLTMLIACKKQSSEPPVESNLAAPEPMRIYNTTITESNNIADARSAPQQDSVKLKASASISEGEPAQTIYLISIGDQEKRAQMAPMLTQSGYECNTVNNAYQVQQTNGQMVDIFKIDCDTGSFQATILNDKVFIKSWTGNMFGH